MIKTEVDLSGLSGLTVLDSTLEQQVQNAGEALIQATYSRILENVNKSLHSSRNTYIKNLKVIPSGPNTWIIRLEPEALWIEEGIPPNTEMIDKVLKGASSKVIPFAHNKPTQDQTTAQMSLTATLQKEMKRRKIPFQDIERGPDGRAKTGKLHAFNIKRNVPKSKFTGKSYLETVNIYQNETKDSKGNSSIQKSIMTFRTMSITQKGSGMWVNKKGFVAKKFMDDAFSWANDKWNNEILPELLKKMS